MKKYLLLAGCLTTAILLFSFKPDNNDLRDLPKIVRGIYAFIPTGTVSYMSDTVKVKAQVGSFYMFKYEVSNFNYREFLFYLKNNGRLEEYAIANCDSSQWENELAYNKPYVDYYFTHEAYRQYPVVNISYEGAVLYCKWLSELYNKQFGQHYTYEVRLPTREEWLRAAKLDREVSPYTWGGPYLTNRKGMALCNYLPVGDESVHRDSAANKLVVLGRNGSSGGDFADITAPVISYNPNDAGLYNMNGNVAEIVAEKGIAVGGSWNSPGYDVRNESMMHYNGPSPFVGFRPVLVVKDKTAALTTN